MAAAQRVFSVFGERELLAQMPPGLRSPVAASLHKARLPRLPALCRVEADLRGSLPLLLERLRPYSFSLGEAALHPALAGAYREVFFVTSGTFGLFPADAFNAWALGGGDGAPPPEATAVGGPAMSKDELFDALDADADGALTRAEVGTESCGARAHRVRRATTPNDGARRAAVEAHTRTPPHEPAAESLTPPPPPAPPHRGKTKNPRRPKEKKR